MAVEEMLNIATFLLLLGASSLALVHVVKHLTVRRQRRNDFTVLMSIFIGGWFSTEMLAALTVGVSRRTVDFAHVFILVIFAILLTVRCRWAIRQASESMEA